MDSPAVIAWPAHTIERRAWRQTVRGGSREDRMLDHVDTLIPPTIADLHPPLVPLLLSNDERALVEVAATDNEAGSQSRAMGRFMLRTESVASSKIERISAGTADYARALAGSRANTSATSMVAASTALYRLVERTDDTGAISLDDLLEAHRALMRDDPTEAEYAGRIRDMQNWIGGSDHSPRGALYVPPPPERVEALLHDLLAFMNRDDIPILLQAAISHAQFESIHPFTDGNGRIGRALISAVLRRRGAARAVIIPVASGILAVRDAYFASLTAYRRGDVAPLNEILTASARLAAVEARTSMATLRMLPDEWRAIVKPRARSVLDVLIDAFAEEPVMNAEDVISVTGGNSAAAYTAIDRVSSAGIIHELTGRKRDRVWTAGDALGELDELDRRIATAMAAR